MPLLLPYAPVAPPLPVAYDATGTGNGSNSSILNWTETISTLATAIVVTTAWQDTGAADTATAKVGSTSMTQLGIIHIADSVNADNDYIAMFGLLNPPTGSQTITTTITTAAFYYQTANSVSYKNVSGFGTAVTNSGTTASMSVSVPSAVGQMAVAAFTTGSVIVAASSFNQTSRYSTAGVGGTNDPLLIGDAPGASTVSFTATMTGASSWVGIGVPLLTH
jgi:hypothetical protein